MEIDADCSAAFCLLNVRGHTMQLMTYGFCIAGNPTAEGSTEAHFCFQSNEAQIHSVLSKVSVFKFLSCGMLLTQKLPAGLLTDRSNILSIGMSQDITMNESHRVILVFCIVTFLHQF